MTFTQPARAHFTRRLPLGGEDSSSPPGNPLRELPVLALDCQGSHGSSGRGSLLEIGWCRVRGDGDREGVISAILRQDDAATVSERVSRMTGIDSRALALARSQDELGRALCREMLDIASNAGLPRCPVVAHAARYERAQLKRWSAKNRSLPPFELVCSHRLSRLLFPELSRHGLRAIAGFIGLSMSETHRAGVHAEATAAIWHHLVDRLETIGIEHWPDLVDWLASAKPLPRPRLFCAMPNDVRARLPRTPGVYRMLARDQTVLYVGKAANLAQRVSSYFRPGARHSGHVLDMLCQAVDLAITPVATALESALVETDLIKEHRPPYNRKLRERDTAWRARKLSFASFELTDSHEGFDKASDIGPLPSPTLAGGLVALSSLLSGSQPDETAIELALNIDARRRPSTVQVVEALRLAAVTEPGIRDATPRRLVAFASRAHRAACQRARAQEQPVEPDVVTERAQLVLRPTAALEDSWSTNQLLARIELVLHQRALMVRRAHWLRLLLDCIVCWRDRNDRGAVHYQMMRDGERHLRGTYSPFWRDRLAGSLARGPGLASERRAQLQRFDIGTYDRLMVLTQELRRVNKDGRLDCLYVPNPKARRGSEPWVCIDGTRLDVLLDWVSWPRDFVGNISHSPL